MPWECQSRFGWVSHCLSFAQDVIWSKPCWYVKKKNQFQMFHQHNYHLLKYFFCSNRIIARNDSCISICVKHSRTQWRPWAKLQKSKCCCFLIDHLLYKLTFHKNRNEIVCLLFASDDDRYKQSGGNKHNRLPFVSWRSCGLSDTYLAL